MKTLLSSRLLLCAILLETTLSLFAQGTINPTGTPGPTMKSLDQIEPRTPISSLPYTISASGSYYLTQDLFSSVGGIKVSGASNVTIDLRGHTLQGSFNSSIPGITAGGATTLKVCNGIIESWGNGVDASSATTTVIEKVQAAGNVGTGILTGPGALVRACTAWGSGQVGIQTGDSSTVVDCSSFASTSDGIHTGNYCSIVDCTSSATSSSNGFGIFSGTGCKLTNCTVGPNGKSGISVDVGSAVQGCVVRGNKINGITSTNNCLITGNNCDNNNLAASSANAGIYTTGNANTIDSNSCTSNGIGIATPSPASKNIIIRNSCSGNTNGNYQVGASAYGPIIDMSAGGVISSSSGTVNPWTNWIH